MVSPFQMQPFYARAAGLEHSLSQQTHNFTDEDDVLDENILDHGVDSALEMSPPIAESRRDSFAVGASSLFSPKTEEWPLDVQSVPSSNNPFLDNHSNNPFMRMDPAQAAAYGAAVAAHGNWSMPGHSAACAPAAMQPFDGLSADFDARASIFQRSIGNPPPAAFAPPQMGLFSSMPPTAVPHSATSSPQKDWVSQTQAMNLGAGAGAGPAKKVMTASPTSPAIRSHNEMRRGDGIRKKNARFEIPAERNLSNIDFLISQSKDEAEIKELKQQKRLLRNRQAALDSRQRKKQHTERLEDEKKQFTIVLGEYEDEITDLRLKMEQLLREKEAHLEYIDRLGHEKDEIIRAHTVESGELRKKVNVLTRHVQELESAVPARIAAHAPAHVHPHAAPYHAAAGGGYDDDMDDMDMSGGWDNCGGFLGEYPVEHDIKQEPPHHHHHHHQQQQQQLVSVKKSEHVAFPAEVEKPVQQGGLLLMLFLVGAFVLSSRSMPIIPRVSEDVRVASATLLENVLKDHGVGAGVAAASAIGVMAPRPSAAAGWSDVAPAAVTESSAHAASSMLGELGDSLTQPTQEQQNEQLFGLSAAQYNGVSSQDFLQNPPEQSTSQGRRNLAEALASIRNGGTASKQAPGAAADVYTRSLLWDRIPGEVVRDFAKMMADCNGDGSDGSGSGIQIKEQCSEEIASM